MSPSWVAPCYVYGTRKCRQAREGLRGWGGGGYFSNVSRFRSGQESQILNKTVSPPLAPRHRQQQNVRPWCYEHLDQCIHVQVRRIHSFMQSFLTPIEEHHIITFFFRTHSTCSLPCKTLRQYFSHIMAREWLPERGIVYLNASPECIISFPGTDQNSSLLHVGKLYWDFISFDMAEHELEWVGLYEMRRLHRLSITGIYARIGLGVRLSRAFTNKSDWLIRGRWIPGMQLNERPFPLRLEERISPSKQLTSTKWSKVHIFH